MDRKTSTFYVCTTCQAFYDQPLGRVVEKAHSAGNVNYLFKTQAGPTVESRCPECDSALHARLDTILNLPILTVFRSGCGPYVVRPLARHRFPR